MSPKHAGESRIADQALIDQVRACSKEISHLVFHRPLPLTQEDRDEETTTVYRLLGQAWSLLEQIGETGE